MNSAYYIKTQTKKPHLSFSIFDDKTGAKKFTIKRKLLHYKVYDSLDNFIYKININIWGKIYELYNFDEDILTIITYDYKNSKQYHKVYIYDILENILYKNKEPEDNNKRWSLKFSHDDYIASKKNIIMLNQNNEEILELGKRGAGTYRLIFNDNEISNINAVLLGVTRFHV